MNDRELELDTRVHAPTLLLRLSAMLRVARIYDVSNQAFKRQLQDFMEALLAAMEHGPEVTLGAVADHLYFNGARIRADASLLSAHDSLLAEFARRSIGGIRFHRGFGLDELQRFFHLFMAVDDLTQPGALAETIARANLEHIDLTPVWDGDADDLAHRLDEPLQHLGGGGGGGWGVGDGGGASGGGGGGSGGGGGLAQERGRAQKVFSRAVTGTRRIVHHAIKTGQPDLRFAKRLVQPVVDNIMKNEYSIIGLTALKSHDEYTYAHCVNVSTLSVGMGHVTGIPRQGLADLGVVGLVHDIGKIMVPADVLRKPAKLTSDEWKLMRRHPLEGVKMMLRTPGLSTLTLGSMRTCLEHQMCVNGSGYPGSAPGWEQACMSRIVALADCYDAMTAHRAYRKRPFTPFEALHRLVGPDRDQFDPAVRWALIKLVGLYPPGSILATDSGHVLLSMSPDPEDPRRPNCKVLERPDGPAPPEDAPEHWDPMGPERRVTRVLKPEDVNINVDEHLRAFA